jgi:hypothetical protein
MTDLCVERDCGQPSNHRNHARTNQLGHFFNTAEPLLSTTSAQQTTEPKQEKPMMPGPQPRRTYVRTRKHQTPPGEAETQRVTITSPDLHGNRAAVEDVDFPVMSPEPRSTPPPVRTEAVIMDAVVKAIRSIEVSSRIRIARIHVAPEYSVSDDAIPIAAKVAVAFSMVFPTAEVE